MDIVLSASGSDVRLGGLCSQVVPSSIRHSLQIQTNQPESDGVTQMSASAETKLLFRAVALAVVAMGLIGSQPVSAAEPTSATDVVAAPQNPIAARELVSAPREGTDPVDAQTQRAARSESPSAKESAKLERAGVRARRVAREASLERECRAYSRSWLLTFNERARALEAHLLCFAYR